MLLLFSLLVTFCWRISSFADVETLRRGGRWRTRAVVRTRRERFENQPFHATLKDDGELQENRNDDDSDDVRWKDPDFLKRNKHWVVLVDDEEPIRMAVGDYLYDSGYQVSACSDARALWALLTFEPSTDKPPRIPDAIVSDIRMPNVDGLELLQEIRKEPSLERIPVILLTAKSLTVDKIAGYRAGADAYLPKPFAPEELLALVDMCIRRRREMTGDGGRLADIRVNLESMKKHLEEAKARTLKATAVFLSPTERDVLDLVAQGLTNGQIAERLAMKVNYVSLVLKDIFAKSGAETRTGLVKWGVQTGYIPTKVERPKVD